MTSRCEPAGRILLVDDDVGSSLVVGYLEQRGHQVLLAENGAQGLAMFASQVVDLVVLDVRVPGLDALQTCSRLRATDRGVDVPILLTGAADTRTLRRALDSCADDVLVKPLRGPELLLRVDTLLRAKRMRDDLRRNSELIRSQRDALLRAHEEKRRLTAMIVHDLRSPLMAMLGNARYVAEQAQLEGELYEAQQAIVRSATAMSRMVMDLLDIAGSEDGTLIPKLIDVDVAGLLRDCALSLRARSRPVRDVVSVSVDRNAATVSADPDLLRRVIDNLLDNAARHAPPDAEIRLQASRAPDGQLLIRVRDHGPGVPAEYRGIVFEPYVRLDAVSAAPEGRGLGLAFCTLAVAAHHGAIWVEDAPGGGAIFCVSLPGTRTTASKVVRVGCDCSARGLHD